MEIISIIIITNSQCVQSTCPGSGMVFPEEAPTWLVQINVHFMQEGVQPPWGWVTCPRSIFHLSQRLSLKTVPELALTFPPNLSSNVISAMRLSPPLGSFPPYHPLLLYLKQQPPYEFFTYFISISPLRTLPPGGQALIHPWAALSPMGGKGLEPEMALHTYLLNELKVKVELSPEEV